MIKTWFTQPEQIKGKEKLNFASFYMYDTDLYRLVRIRMALGRPPIGDDDGCPQIITYFNRVVGTSQQKLIGGAWTVVCEDKHLQLAHNNQILKLDAAKGYYVYDTDAVTTRPVRKEELHFGDVIVLSENAVLPTGVDETLLKEVAEIYFLKMVSEPLLVEDNEADKFVTLLTRLRDEKGIKPIRRDSQTCHI